MKQFDMIVIGSGAGLMVAQTAHANNLKCAIIESSKFGGTCLTKGCIPSKMLVYPADLIRDAQNADRMGINLGTPEFDWEKISRRMWKQINFSDTMEENLKKVKGFAVYNGTAEFTGEKSLRVKRADGSFSEEMSASVIVVANGSRSFVPPIPNLETTGYITSESFFGEKYPAAPWKSLIIVGGGAIGAEFANIFSAFGTKVTVVEMKPHIISTEEKEISTFVKRNFENNGIDVLTNSKVVNTSVEDGMKVMTVEDIDTGKQTTIKAEEIFVSSGVRSNSDTLNLRVTKVECDEKGWVLTDEYMRTTQENIYAIGDINGKYQFRHTANYEAEILIHNLFTDQEPKRACYNSVPWAIFTHPQVAHVGLTEEQVQKNNQKYWVGRNHYSQVAAGIAMGISNHSQDNGFVKIIVGEEDTILGVHIVGPHAAILVQAFVYLMNSGYKCERKRRRKPSTNDCPPLGTFTPINNSMVIHPALSELTAWALDNIEWDD